MLKAAEHEAAKLCAEVNKMVTVEVANAEIKRRVNVELKRRMGGMVEEANRQIQEANKSIQELEEENERVLKELDLAHEKIRLGEEEKMSLEAAKGVAESKVQRLSQEIAELGKECERLRMVEEEKRRLEEVVGVVNQEVDHLKAEAAIQAQFWSEAEKREGKHAASSPIGVDAGINTDEVAKSVVTELEGTRPQPNGRDSRIRGYRGFGGSQRQTAAAAVCSPPAGECEQWRWKYKESREWW